ncbi:MAG TPA: PLP-dependent aminotransferase family protein [Anaerolineales bacterium]|nr:PLP-dependent aminotransferase family protein [Anaerolineales bacterium]
MTDLWSARFASGVQQMRSSAVRDLLKLTEQPDVISFGGGLPAPESFPIEELAAAAELALLENPAAALQYGLTEGYRPLREFLSLRMATLGIRVPVEQVMVTHGSQQGLDIAGRLLIDPGAPVAVEDPSYLGALGAWRSLQPSWVTLRLDRDGLDVDHLEQVLASGLRPRFLYVVSCFQNPTGVTLSPERRVRLLEIAARYGLVILEDDPYGELYFEGSRATPLAALDVQMHGELRHVIYLSTFSKQLAPGLRVGWMAAPPAYIARATILKQGLDLHSNSFAQRVAYLTCRDGLLDRHIPIIREVYRARRDVMLAALATEMPAGVNWTKPAGGMFCWLTLPDGLNATELLKRCLEQKVAFVPGAAFYADGGGEHTARLNFSFSSPDKIRAGVARMGAAFRGA